MMNSDDLKLFAICYIKEHEFLDDKERIQLMEYVEKAADEEVLFLLSTGSMLSLDESLAVQAVGTTVDVVQTGINARDIARAGWMTGKAGYTGYRAYDAMKNLPNEEKPWGPTTTALAGAAISALAASMSMKVNKKYMERMEKKCDKETGIAKKTCHNKIRRDAIRTEIVSLTSMKVKCRKAKNAETCIRNIDKRIKELQNRMTSIKVF
jgi:hypothetical protein